MIDAASSPKKSTAVNVGAQRVAAVYAKALLGATEKAGTTDAAVGELDSVAAALERFPKLEAVFASALIPPEEKLLLLDRLFGASLPPLVLNFLKVLARHGRLEIVRPIRAEVQKLYDVLRGRVRVELRTATAIEDGLSRRLETSLARIVGGQPEVEPAVDPAVIGGIVLRVGDTIYDGSVARQLNQVREQMINRSIHEIQSRRDRFRHPGGN
jgi:F-type H+-transporting ATPase subunit delta